MNLSHIVGIETTTYCNMDCPWCANSLIEDRDMDEDMFDMVLRVLKLFPAGIIAMNGCGEPLMDPDIFERIDRVRIFGYRPVIYTNGTLLDEVSIQELKRAGLHRLCISGHDNIDDLITLAENIKLPVEKAYSPVMGTRTHNWAGQMPIGNTLKNVCNPLRKGWGYINVDGYICQCCLDYDAKYPICHVSDRNIADKVCATTPLCKNCTGSP